MKKGGKSRILLVDDDPVVVRVLLGSLKDRYEITTVASCVELPAALESFSPDLLILDVGLPWVNGYELCRDLRKSERWRETPVLFVSGFGSEEDAARGLAAGGNAYLAKPFDIPVLRRNVADLLSARTEKID